MEHHFEAGNLTFISNKYRMYTEAYFEEIIIEMSIDSRVAKNFREDFLISAKQVKKVLEMYSKNDYYKHFLNINFPILHEDYLELFAICIRNDSFKIAF